MEARFFVGFGSWALAVASLISCAAPTAQKCPEPPTAPVVQSPPPPSANPPVDSPKVRFQAVYFDMDNTLLDSNHDIVPGTLAAIRLYQQCGGLVGLATGRALQDVEKYLPIVRPDLPLVLYNGAVVVDVQSKKPLSTISMPPEPLGKTLEVLRKAPKGITRYVIQYFGTRREGSTLQGLLQELSKGAVAEPPIKVVLNVTPSEVDKVRDYLAAAKIAGARAVVSYPGSESPARDGTVEVLPEKANKYVALQWVIENRRLRPENMLVFGDSENDLEMVGQMPVGFAMENCHGAVCGAALGRIGNHDTDAIGKVLRRIAMYPECKEAQAGSKGQTP